MPTDRYTKHVLTVIAGAPVALVVQNASAPAQAQLGMQCGLAMPCEVRVTNWPPPMMIPR
jgi:hypothetical protein